MSQSATITVRPQVINVLAAGDQPSYSFDRAGRLFGAFVEGVNYRRGLDNRVLAKWRDSEGARQRRLLAPDEARQFLVAAYQLAKAVAAASGDGEPALDVLKCWDWPALEADAERYRQIYRPVSILPPDQYLSLVLQATEGCSYNRCTFCDFYHDRAFRIKGREEFRAHVNSVKDFFGPALGLRKSIFLADANALIAPMPRIRDWLDVIDAAGILPGAGIFSFIDAFDVGRKSQVEWHELARRGLRRAYIGLESGDDELLRFLKKPGSASDGVDAVKCLKHAGVNVCIIVMIGAGGDRFAEQHVANTAAALAAMPLGPGDIVYLSPFVEQPGTEYGTLAAEAGIAQLDRDGLARQEAVLKERYASSFSRPGRGPKFARYNIQEFIY